MMIETNVAEDVTIDICIRQNPVMVLIIHSEGHKLAM